MNIEIIEFYPIEKIDDSLSGTLRVRLVDMKLHILGIVVRKKKHQWFFQLPGRHAIDQKTQKPVRYPCITFEDRNIQKDLIQSIRNKGIAFIERRVNDKENPLVFPKKERSEYIKKAPMPFKEAPKGAVKIANKLWVDPPKLNKTRNGKK